LSVCWSADCNKVMSESLDGMSRIKQSWLQCWPRTCWWQRWYTHLTQPNLRGEDPAEHKFGMARRGHELFKMGELLTITGLRAWPGRQMTKEAYLCGSIAAVIAAVAAAVAAVLGAAFSWCPCQSPMVRMITRVVMVDVDLTLFIDGILILLQNSSSSSKSEGSNIRGILTHAMLRNSERTKEGIYFLCALTPF